MSSTRILLSTVALFVATAGTAASQATQTVTAPDASVSVTSAAQTSGPRPEQTGIRRTVATAGAAAMAAQRPVSMGRPMSLMIVGGAAFVLGAIIEGSVGQLFMLGGAVAFLIGLYEYIR